MKTLKTYTKRLKVTKNGKILSRKAGQDHFNAKERGRTKGLKSRPVNVRMTNKTKSRFLV